MNYTIYTYISQLMHVGLSAGRQNVIRKSVSFDEKMALSIRPFMKSQPASISDVHFSIFTY